MAFYVKHETVILQKYLEAINDGNKSPLKIPANCKTRWLSIELAFGQIIS